MNIILLGPSGCGKGTQAKLISDTYHIPHISSGDVLRAEIAKGSETGKIAESYIVKGSWVPDSMINKLILPLLDTQDFKNGFILDAYPRTLSQARTLDEYLHKEGRKIDVVIQFDLDDKTSMDRMNARKVIDLQTSGKARIDETDAAMIVRLKSYKSHIKNILEYYNDEKILIDINASQTIEQIFSDIKDELKRIN